MNGACYFVPRLTLPVIEGAVVKIGDHACEMENAGVHLPMINTLQLGVLAFEAAAPREQDVDLLHEMRDVQ